MLRTNFSVYWFSAEALASNVNNETILFLFVLITFPPPQSHLVQPGRQGQENTDNTNHN
jgi:hypothetical protein